jgi:translation initiation factor IF-3
VRPRRRFDQARPAQDLTRINEAIRVPRVRLVDSDGSQVGIKERDEALEYAYSKNLDLVEVAANADPPVCRITARKHQLQIHVKEIKLRPKIGIHDYETKKGHVKRFLTARAKVKVTIMFRGREQTHPERGRDLLLRLAEDVKEIGQIESPPLQDGRNMVMVLGPTKNAGNPAPGATQNAKAEDELEREEAI